MMSQDVQAEGAIDVHATGSRAGGNSGGGDGVDNPVAAAGVKREDGDAIIIGDLYEPSLGIFPTHPVVTPNEYSCKSRTGDIVKISRLMKNSDESIFWMTGPAGVGKSTVSQQLPNTLRVEHCLAAEVCFSYLASDPPANVIRIISRQIGEYHPSALDNILKAEKKDSCHHNNIQTLLLRYIIDPVRTLGYTHQLVVVMDGLEQWVYHEEFLRALVHLPSSSPSPVKFFFSSRTSASIELLLKNVKHQGYQLPPVSNMIIEKYFKCHFKNIDWRGRKPPQYAICQLANLSNGLFLWAATVRSLISSHSGLNDLPRQILDRIRLSQERVAKSRDEEKLERLYGDAIEDLFSEQDNKMKLRLYVGASMVLQEPVPVDVFACLSGMSESQAVEIHRQLSALQTSSASEDAGSIQDQVLPAIRQFHASFLQFLLQVIQSNNTLAPNVAFDAFGHEVLARSCLTEIFSNLLPSFPGSYSELSGASKYAVRNWPLHLCAGTSRWLSELDSRELGSELDVITDQAMYQWAKLFLSAVLVDDDGDSLREIPKSEVLLKLSKILEGKGPENLIHRVTCLEVAIRLRPDNPWTWKTLGEAYDDTYKNIGQRKAIDAKIVVFRQALKLTSSLQSGDGPSADGLIHSLACAFLERFEKWGDSNDLHEAISAHKEALVLRPASHPHRSLSLNCLGFSLGSRFRQNGSSVDLDDSITIFQETLELQDASDLDRSLGLNILAYSLQTRFEFRGCIDIEDHFRTIVSKCQDALTLDPASATSLNALGVILHSRFEQRGLKSDLDEAISRHRETLRLCPAFHPGCPVFTIDLAAALLTRFEHCGSVYDLDEAVEKSREALAEPCPAYERIKILNIFGRALQSRSKQHQIPDDLDQAVTVHEEAVDLCSISHPFRSESLNNLAVALQTRFSRSGSFDDLNDAVNIHKEALELRPTPHPRRSESLNNLAVISRIHFQVDQYNSLENLEKAISLHREAIELCPASHPQRSNYLNDLALCFQIRFQKCDSSTDDLDEAVSRHREALELRSIPHLLRASSLNYLANALRTRFDHSCDSSLHDLEESILLRREALKLHPTGHLNHFKVLVGLAFDLIARFDERKYFINDIDEAISLFRGMLRRRLKLECQSWTTDNWKSSRERGCCDLRLLFSLVSRKLSSALRMRYSLERNKYDLDESIRLDNMLGDTA